MNEDLNLNFEPIFEKIRNEIDKLDANREKLLPVQREIIRDCSIVIKQIHRNDFNEIPKKLTEIKGKLAEYKNIAAENNEIFSKNYLNTAYQEYTEAYVLYEIVANKKIPGFEVIGVNVYEYILGLADVIGELKRYVLNLIREGQIETAEGFYNIMEEIHQFLFALDYPPNLMPGFRKKVDSGRYTISKTLETITMVKNTERLIKKLKTLEK